MCIMFYTTKKMGLPSDDTLDLIYDSNPHGGGMAFVYHDKTTNKLMIGHEKGLMTKKLFVERVKSNFTFLTNDNDYMVAHTRIATSGGQSASKTHPFETVKGGYLFHNGIAPYAILDQIKDHTISDTEYLASIYEDIAWLKKTDPNSRYFVINPDGTFEMSGSWEKDKEGRLWSNGGYRHRTYSRGYYGYSRGGYGGSYYEDEGCGWKGNVYGGVNTGSKDRKTLNDAYDNALFELLKIRYGKEAVQDADETLRELGIVYYLYSDTWYIGGYPAKVVRNRNNNLLANFIMSKPKTIIGTKYAFYPYHSRTVDEQLPNNVSETKKEYIHGITNHRMFARRFLTKKGGSREDIKPMIDRDHKKYVMVFVEDSKKKTKLFVGYMNKKFVDIQKHLCDEYALEVVENAVASDNNPHGLKTLLIRNKVIETPKTPTKSESKSGAVATTSVTMPMTAAEDRMKKRLEIDLNNIILDDSTVEVKSLYYSSDVDSAWANVILKKDIEFVYEDAVSTYQKVVWVKLSLAQDNKETEIVDALYTKCMAYLKEKGVKMYEYI